MEHPDLCSYNLPQQINLIKPSCQELRITVDTLQQHMYFTTTTTTTTTITTGTSTTTTTITTRNDSVCGFVLFEQCFHF